MTSLLGKKPERHEATEKSSAARRATDSVSML